MFFSYGMGFDPMADSIFNDDYPSSISKHHNQVPMWKKKQKRRAANKAARIARRKNRKS